MRASAVLLLTVLVIALYLYFFATVGNDGTVMVLCSNVVQTRGGTICMDRANLR